MLRMRHLTSIQIRLAGVLHEYWAISLLMIAFAALGVLYSVVTPLFEVPDEPWHYLQVELVDKGEPSPPMLALYSGGTPGREAQEPPLYYLLGALLIKSVDTGSDGARYQPNPYAAVGQPQAGSNENFLLHLENARPPYTGVALAAHLLRWSSLFYSAITVLLAYLIAGETVPGRRDLAIGAAALVALTPGFLYLSAGVSNDSLAILLSTCALYLALRIVNGHGNLTFLSLALGASVGLAALTKTATLAALLLIPCAYGIKAWRKGRQDGWWDIFRPPLLALAVALGSGAWWYLRNDALAARTQYRGLASASAVSHGWRALLASYWGTFGWMNVSADEIVYTLVAVIYVLSLSGLLMLLLGALWRHQELENKASYVLVLWLVVVVGQLVLTEKQSIWLQGQQLFPAISALSLLLFMGLTMWVQRRHTLVLILVSSLLLFGLSVLAPLAYITPAYARPQRVPLEQTPADKQDLDVAYGEDLFLLGYTFDQGSVMAGEDLHLRLYWLARARIERDYTISIRVETRQGEQLGGIDTFPGGGDYPTRLWVPGEVVLDDYAIPISLDVDAPKLGIIAVRVNDRTLDTPLSAVDVQGRELGPNALITYVRVLPLESVER